MVDEVERLRRTMDYLRAMLAANGRLPKHEWAELEETKLRLQRLGVLEPQGQQ